MTGVRRQQRQVREQAILAAADALFSEHGYSRVNVGEIAERAGVGVATIYKYFGNKPGLIRELFRPEIEKIRMNGERVLAAPDAEPARGVARLIAQYRFGERWQHRDLFREISGLNWGYAAVFEGLREHLDQVICKQIERLVRHYVSHRRMPRGIRSADVSSILYAIHTFHLQEWALREDVSLRRTRANIRRQVLLAFRAWTATPH